MQNEGFKIRAGEGRIHGHTKLKAVNSNILDMKISGSYTNRGLSVFEQTSLSKGKGNPLHLHHKHDETFYVIAGFYKFIVGDDRYDLTTGENIFLPRAIPHA